MIEKLLNKPKNQKTLNLFKGFESGNKDFGFNQLFDSSPMCPAKIA